MAAAPEAAPQAWRTAALPVVIYFALSFLHRRTLRMIPTSGAQLPQAGFVAAVHAVAFLLAARAMRSRQPEGSGRANFAMIGAVMVVEVLSWVTLGRLGSAGSAGLVVGLLSGAVVPYAMGTSRLLLQRQFAPLAWVGSVLVAVGVACCGLGPSLQVAGAGQALLLAAACLLPGLALVGKEALLTGSQPLGILQVAFLLSAAQFVAVLPQTSLADLAAPLGSPLALGSYLAISGALRLSFVWAIQASSAATVQLVNALAVPLGAALLTAGMGRSVQALLLASGGAVLYCLAQAGLLPAAKASKAEIAPAEPVVETAEQRKKRQQNSFMEEMRREQEEVKQKKVRKLQREERLSRMKKRWTAQEKQVTLSTSAQEVKTPQYFSAESGQTAIDAPLTSEEIESLEADAAENSLGTMWKQWMLEHPDEWRRQDAEAREALQKGG